MTIAQEFEKLKRKEKFPVFLQDAMFNILFDNHGMEDQTQFTCEGRKSLKDVRQELEEFFSDFAKEECVPKRSVLAICYVGMDPEIGGSCSV